MVVRMVPPRRGRTGRPRLSSQASLEISASGNQPSVDHHPGAPLDLYYVTIPDKPGEGERLFGALRDAGVNLLAVHAFPSARRSQIDLVPSDAATFLAAAKGAKLKVSKPKTVFLIEGDDRVGAMAQILARLGARGINVTATSAHPHGHGSLWRIALG